MLLLQHFTVDLKHHVACKIILLWEHKSQLTTVLSGHISEVCCVLVLRFLPNHISFLPSFHLPPIAFSVSFLILFMCSDPVAFVWSSVFFTPSLTFSLTLFLLFVLNYFDPLLYPYVHFVMLPPFSRCSSQLFLYLREVRHRPRVERGRIWTHHPKPGRPFLEDVLEHHRDRSPVGE